MDATSTAAAIESIERMKIHLPSKYLDRAVETETAAVNWSARRPCGDCGALESAKSSPVLPDMLEPALYLLDDAMLQGPHRMIQTFVCRSCGRRWQFDIASSEWESQASSVDKPTVSSP